MPTPTLTFNPITSVAIGSAYTLLDSTATINDGGNTLGAVRITLGLGVGSLGVVSGGTLTTTGTIGNINYSYEPAKRLLSLTGATATGANFTQVLRLVGYSKGLAEIGNMQSICVNLGLPIYSTDTGHYYEVSSGPAVYNSAKTGAAAKTFLGLTGYLASVTSASEGAFLFERFRTEGWVGGFFANGTWSWTAGPENGSVFWNGSETGSAVAGKYANWASGEPFNPTGKPYLYFGYLTNALWFASADVAAPYYIEYSTASGTGPDGLSGTRSLSNITIVSAEIASLIQATTPISVAIGAGTVTATWTPYGDRNIRLNGGLLEISNVAAPNVAIYYQNAFQNDSEPRTGLVDAFVNGVDYYATNGTIYLKLGDPGGFYSVLIGSATYQTARSSAGSIILPDVGIATDLITGVVGVALTGITVDASNSTHRQVTINLGTNTNGKRRQPQGFRLMSNGSEQDLRASMSRNGESYTFVFPKTEGGSSAVTLLLN